ncbi:cell envelope integrity protein CreD [Alisedimentitalea sp. MJ-SS2]|uniref:cell envelope integrity protein CreD n=1 Tax=Aliisedimentitalea sp. MJ-SS2 TaxID=3049795 RepID=UPI002910DF32|nr:cell envelope integrity protein CreD [Alisedimentitalea sp. MJ-SS2]MDU8928763.1 cell envelope integrity protein CreD [Alisedimentitalea sp. MJ-SS2]
MQRSLGVRFILIGALTFLMMIPTFFVSETINERADYNRRTGESVGREWGGRQLLSGPVLIVPIEATVTRREQQAMTDPDTGEQLLDGKGNPRFIYRDMDHIERRAPVYLYPSQFDVSIDTKTEIRHRGIFRVPVYRSDVAMQFDFPTDAIAEHLGEGEVALFNHARIRVHVNSNRALRGQATLMAGDQLLQLEPLNAAQGAYQGVEALTGDPRKHDRYAITLGMNGAHALQITPSGRTSNIHMTADWPHPSFFGAFLPDEQQVTEDGFTAKWAIPHLARAIAQVSREDLEPQARQSTGFGVRLYQPNDFYQKSYRAAHYGVLFIGITFLTIFLIEGQSARPAHAVQYILVGLSQSVFFVLLLALSEQFGFATAYLAAAGATIALITAFGAIALHLGRRTWLLGLLQLILYGGLYLILRSADYALLAGSIIAFAAIAGTMFATRNANWHGTAREPGQGLFARMRRTAPATTQIKPDQT